ncbi:MAG: H-NS family nucleoid-associated regulatory protein [Hylemonella sp.]
MGNLIDIQTQIEKLQKQAAEIKTREFDKTVKEILAKMQAFGITLKDLQQAASKTRKVRGKAKAPAVKKGAVKRLVRKTAKKTGAKVAAKYRGPSGETWSGRGLMPRWLAALVKQGRKKDDFAIKG